MCVKQQFAEALQYQISIKIDSAKKIKQRSFMCVLHILSVRVQYAQIYLAAYWLLALPKISLLSTSCLTGSLDD